MPPSGMESGLASASHSLSGIMISRISKSTIKNQPTGTMYLLSLNLSFQWMVTSHPWKQLWHSVTIYNAQLIVDEAHATGVPGPAGCRCGRRNLAVDQLCFARIYTFGKAVGCHGAAVVGSATVKRFPDKFFQGILFILPHLPPSALHAIAKAISYFRTWTSERQNLAALIETFSGLLLFHFKS